MGLTRIIDSNNHSISRFDVSFAYVSVLAQADSQFPTSEIYHGFFEKGQEIFEDFIQQDNPNQIGIAKCSLTMKAKKIKHSLVPKANEKGQFEFDNIYFKKQIVTLSLQMLKKLTNDFYIEIIEIRIFESTNCIPMQNLCQEILRMRSETNNDLEKFLIKSIFLQGIGRFGIRVDRFNDFRSWIVSSEWHLDLLLKSMNVKNIHPLNQYSMNITTKEDLKFCKRQKRKISFNYRTNPLILALCSDTIKILIHDLKVKFEALHMARCLRTDTDCLTLLYHHEKRTQIEQLLSSTNFTFKEEITNIVQQENSSLAKSRYLTAAGEEILRIPGLSLTSTIRNDRFYISEKIFKDCYEGSIIVYKDIVYES